MEVWHIIDLAELYRQRLRMKIDIKEKTRSSRMV